ncbi:hypothetical protein [Seonamhaeicola aphaedonensis]|uniref:Uncharacterized protein n=1 Tax=Seonamhaeicola aphaedonensis TaxID=1461338 RepID=A0A3D9HI21_9FLAO|nr:hypothetical protein [Seonamhaeicola aphaedonensis]RED48911.1 hypothetical protein DFQ02_103242 [Seonamhaeicola aphaedonensis]
MTNPFIRFVIKSVILFITAFLLHIGLLYVLQLHLFENYIVLSYSINLILVVIVFGVLYLLRKKYKSQLGFLFLAGSLVKFAVFFIVFQPLFKQDGDISSLEFASFFVPYLLGLLIETISLSKWLNKLDETTS